MRADSSRRSICSASLCNVSGGERRSACSEPPSHIVDNRSDLWVRIAVAEVRHEARGVGEAKMSAPDEGLGGVGARRIVGGPAARSTTEASNLRHEALALMRQGAALVRRQLAR
jgi:hypothetical protein